MALTYTANIALAVRVKDKEKLLAKGDKLPAGVDEDVIEALRRSGLLTVTGDEEPAGAPAPPPDPETLPAERDTREVWEAYARKVDVDPADYAAEKKPVLVDAVTKAHEAKQAEDKGGTDS